MATHPVATKEEWLAARLELLKKEKEHSKTRDALSQARRDLPWVRLDKSYTFEGPGGEVTLADLFDGRSQLVTYHFMFDPDWDAGCKSCSFITDHFQLAVPHLAQRDTTLVAVSRAPLAKLEAFKKRMGWTHQWVSSHKSDFNYDFHVSWRDEDREDGKKVYYNYTNGGFPSTEGPGLSVFFKDDDGAIFHTYSSYGRGLDILIGAYNYLDLVPKGRGEQDDPYPMAWLKLRDEY